MMFPTWHRSVFAIMDSSSTLQDVLSALRQASFSEEEVFYLVSKSGLSGGFAHVRGSKAPEVALLGVVTGGISGAIIGFSMGVEAMNAAVPIMFALAGAGFCGTIFGVIGALIGLGFPEYRARRFHGVLKNGGILIAVHVEDGYRKKKAKEILKQSGAAFVSVGNESVSGLKWILNGAKIAKTKTA
jgi:hypothetical protein